jgi:hypothetical protein
MWSLVSLINAIIPTPSPAAALSGPKAAQEIHEVQRKRRLETKLSPVGWVSKREAMRVQCLPGKVDRTDICGPIDISLLAHKRVTAQAPLDPNLVALPCVQPDLDERSVLERLDGAVLSDRFFTARIGRVRLPLNERGLVPYQHVTPGPGRRHRVSVNQCDVHTFRLPSSELILERSLRSQRLGEQHETGRVAIDAMDDERTSMTMTAEVLLEQCEDRWRRVLVWEWYAQKAGGLVDNQQQVVLEYDFERAELEGSGTTFRTPGPVHPHSDDVPRAHASRRILDPNFDIIHEDLASLQGGCDPLARSQSL